MLSNDFKEVARCKSAPLGMSSAPPRAQRGGAPRAPGRPAHTSYIYGLPSLPYRSDLSIRSAGGQPRLNSNAFTNIHSVLSTRYGPTPCGAINSGVETSKFDAH